VVLHGKTGTATGDEAVVWLAGWVERGTPTHAYALLLRAPLEQLSLLLERRVAILEALLERQGALPGKGRGD
jgi:beta-lactamase class D